MPMNLRPLSRAQLPLCVPYGRQFHDEFKLPGTFHASVWLRNWQTYYDRYDGIVFGLWDGTELRGGLGAIVAPDICDGRLTGSEMFIFIDHAARGAGLGFMKLLRAFHEWADEQNIEARIVHMHRDGAEFDEYESQLKRIYEKNGYRLLETCYWRPKRSDRDERELESAVAEFSLEGA